MVTTKKIQTADKAAYNFTKNALKKTSEFLGQTSTKMEKKGFLSEASQKKLGQTIDTTIATVKDTAQKVKAFFKE